MKAAGVDVGKRFLDIAVAGSHRALHVPNTKAGIAKAVKRLLEEGVERTGVGSSGARRSSSRQGSPVHGYPVVSSMGPRNGGAVRRKTIADLFRVPKVRWLQ